MPPWIKIGAECVTTSRVQALWRCPQTEENRLGPEPGRVYSIVDIEVVDGIAGLQLSGMDPDVVWNAQHFRPVVPEAADVALFAGLLLPTMETA